MKVIIDSAIPFIEGILEPYASVEYIDGDSITPEAVRHADAMIIRTRTKCNAALLEGAQVKIIVTATIGFDHIDLDYCRSHGIEVCTAAGCNARGVLQWMAAALCKAAAERNQQPSDTTLGIVGVGNVGRLIKEYAEQWGYRTVCCDPPRKAAENIADFVTLDEVARRSDIITFHTPLDASTRHLASAEFLAQTAVHTLIINASRGEVLDTEALKASRRCFMLDVWEHEPNIDREALVRAMVATTHIAGYSRQGKANATAIAVGHIARRFGLPLDGWYPSEVERVAPQHPSWEQMCRTIAEHCDLDAESARLKEHPEEFEHIRNSYLYRREYF